MSAPSGFDQAIEQNHQALSEFPKGDHEPLANLYSRQDDVTLGNPFSPFASGYEQVVETMRRGVLLPGRPSHRVRACRATRDP